MIRRAATDRLQIDTSKRGGPYPKRRQPQAAAPDPPAIPDLSRLAETEEIRAHHPFQPAKFLQRLGVHAAVNLDKGDGLAASLFAAQMKGRDIDSMRTAQASQITDETGLVVIAQIQQVVRKIGSRRGCAGPRQCEPCRRPPACQRLSVRHRHG